MVKPGYKQTEIGVIPEDWECCNIEQYGQIYGGGTPSTNIPKYWDGAIAWCTPSDITKTAGKYISKTDRTITIDGLNNSAATLMPNNSILLCTRATIGELKLCSIPMTTNQGFKNIILNGENSPDFLYYLLQIKKDDMYALAIGSTFLELSKTNLCKIALQRPPFPEQQKIATALSDIDALITNLEKLIAKKKAIKQGAMQELLTGKRRLPGFDGRWEERGLDECCYRISVGLATSVTQYYRPDGTVIFRNLNIKPNYLDDNDILFLDNDFATQNPSKIVHTGDVLTVHTGYVGISCVVPPKYDGALTFTTLISTTKPQMLIPEYLSYHLNSELGHTEVENLQAGGGRNNLNVADFKQYKMRIPSDISEQKAIVAFLKDFDSDLDALQKKLDKLTRIKSGMMSELLTGRIRLV